MAGATMGVTSTATTPRNQRSFRSKSPLFDSSAFHGTSKGFSGGPALLGVSSASTKADLMTKSSRELASEIIQSVRLEQVNKQLTSTTIGVCRLVFYFNKENLSESNCLKDAKNRSGTLSSTRRKSRPYAGSTVGTGDLTNRSIRSSDDQLDSSVVQSTSPRTMSFNARKLFDGFLIRMWNVNGCLGSSR